MARRAGPRSVVEIHALLGTLGGQTRNTIFPVNKAPAFLADVAGIWTETSLASLGTWDTFGNV